MNESLVSPDIHNGNGSLPAVSIANGTMNGERPGVVEFVGASNDTIADAVRRAMTRAARSLRTLEGAGVVVIPQLCPDGSARYRVTLRVTAGSATVQR